MTDVKSAETTEDTGLSEEVETSTNEEAQDTDVSLEDDDFSFEDAADEADGETEESEESTEDEAATESDDETEEESAEDVKDKDTKEDDTASEDSQKAAAQEAYQQREAARRERDARLQKAQGDYLDAAEDVYDKAIERGVDEGTARLLAEQEASNRQVRIDAYNNRIEGNLNKLENGIERAVNTIDLFSTGSNDVKEELASALDDFETMYVKRDVYGNPVRVEADVYQFLQKRAESIRRLTRVGARQESTAKKSVKARADAVPSRAPKEPKVDPDLAAFDEVANRGW